MPPSFDIIGDIHGEAPTLEFLLEQMGYEKSDGCYKHRSRRAIFLGDFIDRGQYQRRVINIVRPMIDSGTALSVMGNHEFNAIAYGTPDGNGGWLRPHTTKNAGHCEAFLNEYRFGSKEHLELLNWFTSLPLWLDMGNLRVVHACWDPIAIALLEREHRGPQLTDQLLRAASDKKCAEYCTVETLLKGKEMPLPDGASFTDKDENVRHHIRIRWWDREQSTYRRLFFGPESALTHIPDDPVDVDHAIEYGHDEPPVFLGHYWMSGNPEPLAPNIACLDYSVAKPGGHLVAYRWDGEQVLDCDRFVIVNRQGA